MPSIGYCTKHAKAAPDKRRDYEHQRKRDPRLWRAKCIRSTARWAKVRRIKIGMNPICEDPYSIHGSKTATADHAHHVKPLVTRPDLAFDIGNLMSLCAKCHTRIEAETERWET